MRRQGKGAVSLLVAPVLQAPGSDSLGRDQASNFSAGQLTAGLSLGLSGVPFYGFDLGGFAGVPPSTELYLRSAAFAAFAPIMQFHSEPRTGQFGMEEREHWNNDRSPWNMAEINRDDRIIPIYRLFANVRLLPYIYRSKHCVEWTAAHGHLIYFLKMLVSEMLKNISFGRDLLVAPSLRRRCGAWYICFRQLE